MDTLTLSFHRNYIDKCVIIIKYFNNQILPSGALNLPKELVYYITRLIWQFRSEPVLLYDTQESLVSGFFKYSALKLYPEIRICDPKCLLETLTADWSKIMSNFRLVLEIMLIPGSLWDKDWHETMTIPDLLSAKVDISNHVEVFDGVQFFYHKLTDGKLISVNRDFTNFGDWIQDAAMDPDFLKVQNRIS